MQVADDPRPVCERITVAPSLSPPADEAAVERLELRRRRRRSSGPPRGSRPSAPSFVAARRPRRAGRRRLPRAPAARPLREERRARPGRLRLEREPGAAFDRGNEDRRFAKHGAPAPRRRGRAGCAPGRPVAGARRAGPRAAGPEHDELPAGQLIEDVDHAARHRPLEPSPLEHDQLSLPARPERSMSTPGEMMR